MGRQRRHSLLRGNMIRWIVIWYSFGSWKSSKIWDRENEAIAHSKTLAKKARNIAITVTPIRTIF